MSKTRQPRKRLPVYDLLKLWSVLIVLLVNHAIIFANSTPSSVSKERAERILKKSNQKAYFEKNIGQTNDSLKGYAQVSNMTARFYEDKVSFVLESGDKQDVFVYNMNLLDISENSSILFKNKKDGFKNYVGCIDEVPLFEEVRYENIYPNIDLRFYVNQTGELEFDFIVLPGGDPNQIHYALDGVEDVKLTGDGSLAYCSPFGELTTSEPFTYQGDNHEITEVETGYSINKNEVSFSVSSYDKSSPLIIDPTVFEWSTYIGGGGLASTNLDQFFHQGEFLYVCGTDLDPHGKYDYPITPGAYSVTVTIPRILNLVVSKFDTLGVLQYSTYLPFDNRDAANNHIFDFADNSVFFAFEVNEKTNFTPGISPNAFDSDRGMENVETVIGKLDINGILEWSSYLGGSNSDIVTGLSVADGIVTVAGVTNSTDFPLYQANVNTNSGVADGFFSKFDYGGNILYSSYVGVPNPSIFNSRNTMITKDGYTALYFSLPPGFNFPITQSPAPNLVAGRPTIALVVFDSNNNIQYSTQYNNNNFRIRGIEFDGNQLCMYTLQPGDMGFTTPGAYIESNPQSKTLSHLYCVDVPSASLNFATYIHDESSSQSGEIAIENGFVYHGDVTSPDDFPNSDLFLQKFDQTGNLVYHKEYGFKAYQFTDIKVYNGEVLMYTSAFPEKHDFTPTPDAVQVNPLGVGIESSYLMRTDINGNYTYGTWISGKKPSTVINAFIYNGSIYASGFADFGFPTTVGAFQTLNGGMKGAILEPSFEDLFVLKISDAECLDDFTEENIIQPELIEVCMNGTVPFMDGPMITVDEDSISHYLIDDVLTPADNNFIVNYQWQIKFVGSTQWVNISGATNPAFQSQPLADDAEFRRLAILEYAECLHIDTSNISLVDVNHLFAPSLPPDTVYYKCETSSIRLDVTAAGGTPPYNYVWTPSAGLSNPNSPTPTTNTSQSTIYNVEVTDSNGCLFIEQFTVRVYEANAGDAMIACIGTGVQIGTPHIAPGVEGFQYSWSPAIGLSNPNIPQPIANPPGPITYTLSLTGPDGCTVTDDILVEPVQTVAEAGPDVTFCLGGSIDIGEPNDPDYDFIWSPGQHLNDNLLSNPIVDPDELPNVNPLTYYVTKIHRNTGCTDFDSIQVYVNNANAGIDFCGPRFIGSADHSSGLASFNWTVISGDAASIVGQESLATPFVAPNQPTLYQLQVTWNGVTCTDQVLVPNCGCLLPQAEAISDLNCEIGDFNFNTIVFGTSIDTSRYTYLWTPSAGIPNPTSPYPQNFNISLTTATTYTLTSTLKTNSSVTCETSILLFPAPQSFAFEHAVDTITCLGEGVNIGGPTIAGWSATWTPDNGTLNQTSIFNPIATPTELTNYIVTLEENSSGCQFKDTAIVEIFEIIADAGPDGSFCENSIIQLGTPAIPGLVYSWQPSLGLHNNDTAQPIDTIFASTTYYLTVSDSANTCSIIDTLVYTVVNNPDANAGQNIVICQGGLGAQIGTPAIPGNTYLWSPSTGLSNPNVAQPFANPTSTTVYTLTVGNNAEGCFSTDAITVTVSNGEPVDAGPNAIVCLNESVQIGTSPSESGYSYSWTPTTGLNDPNIPEPTATVTDTITYTVTVTSPTGCIVQDTVSLMPSIPLVDAGEDINTCPSIDVIIGTPALPGYSYAWIPSTGLSNPTIAQPMLTTSTNQVYTLTATDANNCVATDQVVVTVESISVEAGPDKIICSTSVSIGAASQGAGFIYSWSPNISLSNPNIAQPFALPSVETIYTVTMTQISTGCSATDMVTVSPSAITDAGPDQIACLGESVVLGNPAIAGSTYSWSPAAGLDNPNIAQPTATVSSNTTYILTVTNGGCMSSDQVSIIVHEKPEVELDNFDALCLGACAQIGPTPSPLYRYNWSPSLGLSDPNIADPIACPMMTTIYTLVITDLFSGCSTEENVTVNVSTTPPPEPDAGLDKELCPGENTQIGATNQDEKLAYSWSPTTFLTSPFAPTSDVIVPGGTQGIFTYILTATNTESGCQGQDTVVINIHENPMAPIIPDEQACQNSTVLLCEGCIENPGYAYLWSPGHLVSDSTSLSVSLEVEFSTVFELNVTDELSGCSSSTSVTIEVNQLNSPEADAGSDQVICLEEIITIGQSDDGETYTWYPEELRSNLSNAFVSNPMFTPVDTGTFILWLEVENTEGCLSADTIEIQVLDDAILNAGTSFFTCDRVITLSGSIDMGEGEWTLFSGPNTPSIINPNDPITEVGSLIPGTYRFAWTVTSTDVCNTGDFDLLTVVVEAFPTIDAGKDLITCINVPLMIGQDDEGLIYTWFPEELRPNLSDPFSSNPTFTATELGDFTLWVVAESTAGCLVQDTVVISALESVVMDAGDDFSTCDTEFTLNGSSSLGDGIWVSSGGPSTPLIHTPTSPSTLVTQVVPGSYEFTYVNTTQEGVCNGDAHDFITVVIFDAPQADAGPDLEICDDETATLGPDVGDDSYEWFPVGQRLNLSDPFIRNPIYSPASAGTFEFWVEVSTDDGCIDIDTMQLVVQGYATIDAVNPLITCFTEVNLQGSITNGEGVWSFINGPTEPIIETPSDPNTLVTNLVPGEYTFEWTVSSEDVCNTDEFISITLEVLDSPTPTVDIICGTFNNVPSFTYTLSVDGNGVTGTYDVAGFDTHTALAYDQTHGPFGPFLLDNNSYELTISSVSNGCADLVEVLTPLCGNRDFGDLPDTGLGNSPGNYETYSYNNGPSHSQIDGLRIANRIDSESEAFASPDALGDGNDEDAYAFLNGMEAIKGAIYVLSLDVLNTTGSPSYLEIWVDWNGDGDFMDVDEFVFDEMDDGNGNFSASTWNLEVPDHAIENQNIGLRARLSLEDDMTPYGPMRSGEVEDYLFSVKVNQDLCLPIIIRIEN